MSNNETCKIVRVSDVLLTTALGCKLRLKDVICVPKLKLNLISLGKLDNKSFPSHFVGLVWKLTKGNLIIAKG